jgi:hypothetical protein
MQVHNYHLEDKILATDRFIYNRNPPSEYGLYDKVLCYFDGHDRKVVPLRIALSFPIIYDKYIGQDNKLYDMTIAICPFTLAAAILDGKFVATGHVKDSCLVITNNKDTFPIINSYQYVLKTKELKSYEADIKILRNVFTEYPDCKYMVIQNDVELVPIVNNTYYDDNALLFDIDMNPSNQFHNKTLVYLIQYLSSKDQSLKSTIVVGHDANSSSVTGYNVVESGIYSYLVRYESKINQKFGFVMPILWFAWKSFFPESKIIYLPAKD